MPLPVNIIHDFHRLAILLFIGLALVAFSPYLSEQIARPELASGFQWAGVAFIALALSHVARRTLFFKIDLQGAALLALQNPIGAGLVFVGICHVLAAFVQLTGSLFAR